MLSDLRESVKARDSYIAHDIARNTTMVGGNQATIGEKMSLAGESGTNTMKAKIFNMSTLEMKERQLSQNSDGVETYSSKQYKINPLLLDDQILKQVQQPTSEPSHDFHREQ